MSRRPCPACQGDKLPSHYLCGNCWSGLPRDAKRLLSLRDPAAFRRLSELLDQLRNGLPLSEIRIGTR
jgi:hypothetical protein